MPKLPKTNKQVLVLDTFALLCLFYKQTGYTSVENYLNQAKQNKIILLFNEVNLGEIYYRIWKNQGQDFAQKTLTLIHRLPIEIVSVDREFILAAASWKAQYKISYADSFVVETAFRKKCPILTGDPEFDTVAGLKIIRLGGRQ